MSRSDGGYRGGKPPADGSKPPVSRLFTRGPLVDAAELEGRISVDVCECNPPMVTSIGRCGYCCGIIPPAAPTGYSPADQPTPAQRWRNLRALVDTFAQHSQNPEADYRERRAWTQAAAELLKALYGTADQLNPVTP